MGDNQIFLRFSNFYRRFVEYFGNIIGLLSLMVWMSSITWSANNLSSNIANNTKISTDDDRNETIERLLHRFNTNRRMRYLNPDAKKAFTELRSGFIQVSVFQHSYPEQYIWIETIILDYTISRVLN